VTSGKRPNIVIFNPDQWRGDVVPLEPDERGFGR